MEEKKIKFRMHSNLFNSALETGVRSLILLEAAYPRSFDLKELTWLDHLVVHTNDVAGPDSLHPNLPHRDGELIVRRVIVEQGLNLMCDLSMVERLYTDTGITYISRDSAGSFVQLIRTKYGIALKQRAKWLISFITDQDGDYLHRIISKKIGRWTIEFQNNSKSGDS